MPMFTNTSTAPVHVGGVMIVPGTSAAVADDEPLLKSKGFAAMMEAGVLHKGELTEEEQADLARQEKEMAEQLARDGKDARGKPAAKGG